MRRTVICAGGTAVVTLRQAGGRTCNGQMHTHNKLKRNQSKQNQLESIGTHNISAYTYALRGERGSGGGLESAS